MDEFRRRLMMIQTSGGGNIIPTTDGVYILGTDNKFYKKNEWNQTTDKAVGVAIIDPKSNFVIAPSVLDAKYRWSAQLIQVQGIVSTADKNKALKDFAGYNNTQKMIEQDTQARSAIDCTKYKFKNGMSGYLPSFGELNIISQNLQEVNLCLDVIGCNRIGVDMNKDVYWSSTQNGADSAWRMYLTDGYSQAIQKTYLSFILPLAKL